MTQNTHYRHRVQSCPTPGCCAYSMQHSHKRTWCPFPLANIAFGAGKIREKNNPKNQRPPGCYEPGRQKHPPAACDRSLQPRLLPAPHTEGPTLAAIQAALHPSIAVEQSCPACSSKTGLTAPPSWHFYHGASCETRGSGAGRSLAGAAALQDSWLSLSAELQHCCPHPGTSSTHGQSITTHPQPHPCGKPPRGSSATKGLTQS